MPPIFPPKYDYAKLIAVGMPFEYEIGKKVLLNKMPRWDYVNKKVGWFDHGMTNLLADAEVLAIQEGLVIFALLQARNSVSTPNQTPQYIVPIDGSNKPRGVIFNPHQWEWDGFFRPYGGWEQYLPIKEKKVCSCGAEAHARLTNQPISGHGVYCPKWEPNPYQR